MFCVVTVLYRKTHLGTAALELLYCYYSYKGSVLMIFQTLDWWMSLGGGGALIQIRPLYSQKLSRDTQVRWGYWDALISVASLTAAIM